MKTIGYAVLAVLLLVGILYLLYPGASEKRGAGHKTAGSSAPSRALKTPKVVEVNPPASSGMQPRDLARLPRSEGPDLMGGKWPNLKQHSGPTAEQLMHSGLPADKAKALAETMTGPPEKELPEPPPYPTVLDMTPAERQAAIQKGVTHALAASKTKLSPEARDQIVQQLSESVNAGMTKYKELYLQKELQEAK